MLKDKIEKIIIRYAPKKKMVRRFQRCPER
jgi:hypothetical protein